MGTPKTVAFLLYDGCTLLDFSGATQVFARWASGWTPLWVAREAGPVKTSEGVEVIAPLSFADTIAPDVVFVPGGDGAGVAAAMGCQDTLDWLRGQAAKPDMQVGAVCVGTFILGAADLLRGSKVSTHWLLLDVLRDWSGAKGFEVVDGYPRAVIDRDTRRFTGGGVSASIDLALALVRDLESVAKANYASLIIQYDPDLPEGVLPGNPDDALPATVQAVTTNPAIQTNFVGPIAKAVAADP